MLLFAFVSSYFVAVLDKKDYLIKLGLLIKAKRIEAGMSQRELAHAFGKEQQNINRLEAGKVNVSIYFLAELAEVLKIDVAEFTKID